jgi:uncharacterized protein YciI
LISWSNGDSNAAHPENAWPSSERSTPHSPSTVALQASLTSFGSVGLWGALARGVAQGSRPAAHPHTPPYHTFHMGYYLLEYVLIDDYLARRAPFREAHLALAREAHRRGDLILAGALAEPTDRAVLVWRTHDRSVIERFIDGDPYVHNGLVTSWTIRPWTVVIAEGAGQS